MCNRVLDIVDNCFHFHLVEQMESGEGMRWCCSKENGISSNLGILVYVQLNDVGKVQNLFDTISSSSKKHTALTQVKATSWWFLFVQD